MSDFKKVKPAAAYMRMDERDLYHTDMMGTDDPGAKRMNRAEQDMMIRLYGVCIMLDDVISKEYFANRLRDIPRGYARLKEAHTKIRNVMEAMAAVTPEDQMEHMRRNLGATKYMTYTAAAAPIDRYRDMGRWMSFEELNMVATVCREQCKCCIMDDPQEQRKCPINKIMRRLPIDNAAADRRDACGWLEVLGSC